MGHRVRQAPKSAHSKPLHYHPGMKVFVTDADTSFAQALLPALCRSEAVEAVTGGSKQPLPFEDPKFQRINLERGDAVPAEVLRGHDALVYLASRASLSSSSPADSIDASVRPIHKLFQEAHAAGVQRLVLICRRDSATVHSSN